MDQLTDRQERVMEFLRSFLREKGYPPTMREMGQALGFSWPAARGYLRTLERKGHVKVSPNRSRGIELVGQSPQAPQSIRPPRSLSLPLVGQIRAGAPILAHEEREGEHISVDLSLFAKAGQGAYVLRVLGDSMVEAGILEGDYVVVRPQASVDRGAIGVALVGGMEATVKKIYVEGGAVTLVPCNSALSPTRYPADEVEVLGQVVGVIRKL